MNKIISAVILLSFVITGNTFSQQSIKVKARERMYNKDGTRSYAEWKEYETLTVESLKNSNKIKEPGYSKYGGRTDKKENATGFFHTAKSDGRWWLVDPEGNYFIHKGIVSVKPGTSNNQISAVKRIYGNNEKWLESTVHLLKSNGFNGTGNWSDTEQLRKSQSPPVYTHGFNFMSAYGKKRGGTFQQPGHTGYPNDLVFIFDPEFESFCYNEAMKAEKYKNDKNLLGYFSDNEMPFPEDALDRYLKLEKSDAGYRGALEWLNSFRKGKNEEGIITKQERDEFLRYMAERYFRIVSDAIKKYDPNHMYLGCRFHGGILNRKPVFEAAGKYMDAVSVNYYGVWTPNQSSLSNWSTWSGKPVIITEWYTKASDSGMKNESGAGWIVPTQKDRGLFYQNFVLALLKSKICVGWHWFKYQDNDPEDKNTDPSNKDSNKGIIDNNFNPYGELLMEMKKINLLTYGIIDYFDDAKMQVNTGGK